MSAKNKLGIVNGTIPRPAESSPIRSQWERVNDMVISWILNTVSDEISNGMDFVNTAQEVWDELNDQFSSINGHRVYQILKDLHALEQGDKSVEIYYHRMKNLWDEYTALEPLIPCKTGCKCESHKLQEDREQRKKLLQFLMGLNESFSAARGQILMMNPLPSIAQAFSLIKQEEKQRQGGGVPISFLANARHGQYQNNAGRSTHSIQNQNEGNASAARKSFLKCNYCHKEGHLKENCFKLVGYPPKGRGKGRLNQGSTSISGSKIYPQAQVASVIGNTNMDANVTTASSGTGTSQNTIDQLHQQVTQMANLMNMMITNNNKGCSTPEDHITNSMAGPAPSENTSHWC